MTSPFNTLYKTVGVRGPMSIADLEETAGHNIKEILKSFERQGVTQFENYSITISVKAKE